MTSDDLENHFFLITGARASFRYVIYLGLKMFEFWPKMTPNTPKWPQPQTYKIKNLYSVLGFNLSYPKLWLVNCVTRYLKNKPKPEVAHKTGSRTNFEKMSGHVWFFWSKEPLCKVSAKSIREKYSFREFCRWDRGFFSHEIGIFFVGWEIPQKATSALWRKILTPMLLHGPIRSKISILNQKIGNFNPKFPPLN